MQKSCLKRNSKFAFISLIFLLACTLMLTIVPSSSVSVMAAAAVDPFQTTLPGVQMLVTAYKKDGQQVGGEEITSKTFTITGEGNIEQQMSADSMMWSDVKYFKIEMSGLDTITDASEYSYYYTVSYIPQGIDTNNQISWDNAAILKDVTIYPTAEGQTEAEAEEKTGIKNSMYFFIDDNEALYKDTVSDKNIPTASAKKVFESKKETHDYTKQGGWGTYVFTFHCNGGETSGGKGYEVLPTKLSSLSTTALSISAEKTKPATSIVDAYIFRVNEPFQYVNREYFTWDIEGTGADGTKYVLFDNGQKGYTALYQVNSVDIHGSSFTFDKGIQGTWVATVVVDDGAEEDGVNVNSQTATSEEVSTIKPFSTEAIIWIVSAVTIVAVGVVAAIIIVTIKKEKTW